MQAVVESGLKAFGVGGSGGLLAGLIGSLSWVRTTFTGTIDTTFKTMAAVIAPPLHFVANLTRSVFGAAVGFVVAAVEGIRTAFTAAWAYIAGAIASLRGPTESTGGLFTWLRDTISYAFVVAEFGIKHFGAVFNVGMVGVQLGLVTLGEELRHILTERIPTYLLWFGENFFRIIQTAWNYFDSFAYGIVANFKNMMGALWAWLKSGGTAPFEFAFTPLTTGFENTIKAMPEIAARAVGETESSLTNRLQQATSTLSSSFSDFKQKRMAELEAARVEAAKAPSVTAAPALKMEEFNIDSKTSVPKAGEKDGMNAGKGSEKDKTAGAAERGSKEAYSAVAKAQRESDRNAKDTAKNTRDSVKVLNRIDQALSRGGMVLTRGSL